ncbi:LysR family transcriptional regulator [Laribacter hongkongensis]|uniref:LysR substrate-binding domain-containing protein n=1 Tax=Laribacter hongkongensis TaxID=168471 RepID=UPI001877798A|nr:LysR substrate-binding domain-containing protein [Laribacter hongkongensis]MBE5528527.1 LysR family transcriptional regulator [Laribacter hongkongensis]
MRFTLKQLEVFTSIARHENVSRAADELALSQSAASGALAELERHYGVQLFDRAGKRLRLNDLGHALLPPAMELLDRAHELDALLRHNHIVGPLAIGATLTIGNYLAPIIVSDYLQTHPGARVRLEVANTSAIVEQVAHFGLDLGLIEGHFHHPDLESLPWGGDSLECFVAPDHPLAGSAVPVTADMLAARPWIVRESGSGTRQAFDRAFASLGLRPNILLELEHTEAIKRAVESGLGIGCVSALALREAFRRGSLVKLETPDLSLRRQFHIALHRQKYRSAGLTAFLSLCQAQLDAGLLVRPTRIP